MKYLLFILFLPVLVFGQSLRQSDFFTSEQAIEEHKDLAQLYNSKEDWQNRAAAIRQSILHGAGIKQIQFGLPVNATIHSKKVMDGYSVENVFFESIPGVYVSGNLYEPLNLTEKAPAVLCPHGHGRDQNNRFMEYTQQRCATLARMGAVVFAYDMLGYGDFKQADHKIENVFKIQLLNSVRIVDFLSHMEEVDSERIAITGESGGGTQTFMLSAIDDRIAVSVPTVMVSGYFFGGCQCESGMPVHTSFAPATTNVEVAACMAPKPLMLISDGGDWTRFVPEMEAPHIRRIYSFFEAGDQFENAHFPEEKHDYGPSKRQAAYHFLARHLELDIDNVLVNGEVDETRNTILTPEFLSVYTEQYPRPAAAVMGNEALIELINNF
ncbi:S9 family peptidase [Jiulongibacter sediminis]|uniref:alpha/beta hydrolase family protein n=1 Tax=Jiulongibacter sediminis TaxID=1605367 RepID=UPI0026E982A6|nr:acetylxylan esterase [Jiulongibacter sediminis]